jgi:formylglycine-generating enzyme required for sulfatase activity
MLKRPHESEKMTECHPGTKAARAVLRIMVAMSLITACEKEKETQPRKAAAKPRVSDPVGSAAPSSEPVAKPQYTYRCPSDMVEIPGEYCIDQFEVSLVDSRKFRPVSPFYSPTYQYGKKTFEYYQEEAENSGTDFGKKFKIPKLPEWQLEGEFGVRAQSKLNVLPNGYMSQKIAKIACENAGKRLCTKQEWTKACKGEDETKYPYGNTRQEGKCNDRRARHALFRLHGTWDHHHDPRAHLVESENSPLLKRTGSLPECSSKWGADAVYDMVGNLDEWVDDNHRNPQGKLKGSFMGGFYSYHENVDGCDTITTGHSVTFDGYSVGTRCCKDIPENSVKQPRE